MTARIDALVADGAIAASDVDLATEGVAIVAAVLGEEAVVGAYLHGSAVLGGLRGTSDLDVLAVVRRPTQLTHITSSGRQRICLQD